METPTKQRKDGTVQAEDEVRRVLRALIWRKGRPKIAQSMTELLGRTITASMLADFTRNGNGKRQVRFPLAWTKALGRTVGSDDLAKTQLSDSGRNALALGELLLPWLLERGAREQSRRGSRKGR